MGMVGNDGHIRFLGKTTGFLQPITSAVLQRSWKALKIVCCHYWRTKEDNILHALFIVPLESALSFFNVSFILKTSF